MTSKVKVQKKIQKILAGYTGKEASKVLREQKLVEDLGLSSFDIIYIVSEIEDKLGVFVDISNDFAKIITVDDLCNYAYELMTAK